MAAQPHWREKYDAFDMDTFLSRYINHDISELYDDLELFYQYRVRLDSGKEILGYLETMRQAARQYKSKKLAWEASFFECFILLGDNNPDMILVKDRISRTKDKKELAVLYDILEEERDDNFVWYRIGKMEELIREARRRGDRVMELRGLHFTFIEAYYTQIFSKTFTVAETMIERLAGVTEEEFPWKRAYYFDLGEAYYRFRDYGRAEQLMRNALIDSTRFFFDRSNLRSLNTLGLYYRNIGDIARSDSCFHAMLASPDKVTMRRMYDVIAIGNLGHNLTILGEYDQALRYYHQALPVAYEEDDISFASGITVKMGECYLGKGDLANTRLMIDSTITLIGVTPPGEYRSRHLQLFPLISRYYAYMGDMQQMNAYLDSTSLANKQNDETYNAMVVLKAEQELFEADRTNKEKQIRSQQRILWSVAGGCLLLLIVVVIIWQLYRQKQKAYRKLVVKSQEWAKTKTEIPVYVDHQEIDAQDQEIMKEVYRIMEHERLYRDANLTLDLLAEKLNIRRNTLSKAINAIHKKHFNNFINDYRLKEVIQRLSENTNNDTIEAVAFDCGFNTRQTFYRLFKAETGLSPALFRKNK